MSTVIAYSCTYKLTAYAKLGRAVHWYVQGLWQHIQFKEEMPCLTWWKEKSPVFMLNNLY